MQVLRFVPRRSLIAPLHVEGLKDQAQGLENTKSFSAVIPPHVGRLASSTGHNIPVPGASMLVVPRTADFYLFLKTLKSTVYI